MSGRDLTLFCSPKPFRGHFGMIQRNAIGSWTKLDPAPEVFLFGKEEGTEEAARDLRVRHVAEVACSPSGTPRVDALFGAVRAQTQSPWLAYINADIMLLDDFSRAFAAVQAEARTGRLKQVLLCSQRVDVVVRESIDFADAQWSERIRTLVSETGVRMRKDFIDLILFTRDLFPELPPLVLGRPAWDNYMLWKARKAGAAVIDASSAFGVIHQAHDYSHAGGWQNVWKGEEAQTNQTIARGRQKSLTSAANYILDGQGLRRGKSDGAFDEGEPAIGRIKVGLLELERGNVQGARDFFTDAIRFIEGLQRDKARLERRRFKNRIKAWLGKISGNGH